MELKNSARKQRGLSGVSRAFMDYKGFLRNFLRRYLSREHDVDDVLQQAYLQVFDLEHRGEKVTRPKALLFTVAKNVALNELNRKSSQITAYIDECMPEGYAVQVASSAESEAEAQQTLGKYCEAVAALPPKCREVYLLRKVQGLSHKQIAERMNISTSAVEKHLHTGLSRCRVYLEKGASQRAGAYEEKESSRVSKLVRSEERSNG